MSSEEINADNLISKEDPKNRPAQTVQILVTLFAGLVIVYGIFGPWLSVGTIFTISSNKGEQGLILFINSFFLLLVTAAHLAPQTQLGPLRKKIRIGTYISTALSVCALIFFYTKVDAIASDFLNSAAAKVGLDNSLFDLAVQPLINRLATTLQPQIEVGFYSSFIGVALGLFSTLAVGKRSK